MYDDTRLIDSHAHLHLAAFEADREDVLARAATAGVARIIEIGYDLPSSYAAVELAARYPHIYAVVGIQPNHVHQAPPDWREQVRALAANPQVVAIGEIGLDYYWKASPPELQAHFFQAQIELAEELGMPIVIHSREAHADTLALLRSWYRDGPGAPPRSRPPGVMHSFSGDWAYATACLELGFYLSFSGPLTFPRAAELREVARLAPADRILVETDSPYLSPHPHRGRRNEPAHVRLIAEQVAASRGEPLDTVVAQIWSNTAHLFHIA